MSRFASALLILALAASLSLAQKKPEPAKPESAPASQPTFLIDAELQKEIDSMNAEMNVKLNCVPGKNFDVVGTINPTQLALLMEVADRAFKVFEEVTSGAGGVAGPSTTGQTPAPAGQTPAEVLFNGRKCLIAVFNNSNQYQAFGRWYDGHFKDGGSNALTMKTRTYFPYAWPRACVVTHLKPHDMNMLRNVVAHEVGHVVGYRYAYNNNYPPVWLVEGLATWIEGKTMGTTNCYCFSGGYGDANSASKNLVNREWSKWKAQLKSLVKAKQDKAVDHIMKMQLDAMTMNDVGKAMALVDYMTKTDSAKFARFLATAKKYWPPQVEYEWLPAKGEAQKKALQEVWAMDWPELDEAVRKYVQANY
jgi:hypothetical protein